MSGDAKRRFCEHCQLHVHNLSAMSGREREELVAEAGDRLCVAYELRGDGSMVTPSRWAWPSKPLRRVQQAVAALLAASFPMLFSACSSGRQVAGGITPNRHVAGGIAPPSKTPTEPTVGKAPRDAMLLGEMAPPPAVKKP